MDILVIDDEEVIRNLFTDILSEEGHNIITANNGMEGIEEINKRHFHIIFMDVHMPVMNGLDTLKVIKEVKPEIIVAIMDSYPDRLLEEAQKRGAYMCLHKPFEIWEIMEIINNVAGDYP